MSIELKRLILVKLGSTRTQRKLSWATMGAVPVKLWLDVVMGAVGCAGWITFAGPRARGARLREKRVDGAGLDTRRRK
jgi:hypothetical protein